MKPCQDDCSLLKMGLNAEHLLDFRLTCGVKKYTLPIQWDEVG